MWTALISTVLGMIGGVLPDILKEITNSREHKREIERMQVNAELQLKMLEKQTDAKLAEIDAGVVVEEMKAFRAQMENIYKAQVPSGVKWIDGFNALIRPLTAFNLMALFILVALIYCWALFKQYYNGNMEATVFAETIWGSLVGQAIQAVLGYLFGYRSTRTVVSRLSSPQPLERG